jgi:RimJ/RimL family protein N-acetyltransferase
VLADAGYRSAAPLMRVISPVAVRLHPMALSTARGLLRGERVVDGPPWHPAYPLAETLIGVSLLSDVHRAAGWDGRAIPAWWIHQVVSEGVVVGDIGFHGPPDSDGVVEIGYALVGAARGLGVASAACAQVLGVAWRDGAARVIARAAADNPASRRVLVKSGFTLCGDEVFEVGR